MTDVSPAPMLHATSAPPGNGSPATTTTVDVTSRAGQLGEHDDAEQRRRACFAAAAVVGDPVHHGRDQGEDDGHGACILGGRLGRDPAGSERASRSADGRGRLVVGAVERARSRRAAACRATSSIGGERVGERRAQLVDSRLRRRRGHDDRRARDPRPVIDARPGRRSARVGDAGGGRASGRRPSPCRRAPDAIAPRLASCEPVNVTSADRRRRWRRALIQPDRLSSLLAASRRAVAPGHEHAAVAVPVGIGQAEGEGADDGPIV